MSVRLGLLAILDQGACYGYQLRAEYARRTGTAPLNVGQIYTTLERLERDGLVERQGADARGHVYWGITGDGRAESVRWFAETEPRIARDELAVKVALALSLPGVDRTRMLDAHTRAAAGRLEKAERDAAASVDAATGVVRRAARAHARADVEWLAEVARASASTVAFGLSDERPRRGRPTAQATPDTPEGDAEAQAG